MPKYLPWVGKITLSTLAICLTSMPVKSAEKIYFVYPPLKLSLQVSSIETFARDGTINDDLKFYLNAIGATEERKAKLREVLVKPVKVDPVILARMLNAEVGERLIEDFGYILNVEGGRNGKYIIRGAMIQAAFSPEGLTVLTFLEKLATDVEFDLIDLMAFIQNWKLVVKASEEYVGFLAELSSQEADQSSPVDFSQLRDPGQPGPFAVDKQTWYLTDNDRLKRSFYVDVYRPQTARSTKTPVVIISHGLGSRPEDFADKAKYLASYGYVVAVPQHIGSDQQYAEAFKKGYARQYFELDEFINRPLDISYVIDELERRNATEFAGRLDLENVGVFGHSFGGYTALAVAGATIDFDYLRDDCILLRETEMFNTSLLLQCPALELEHKAYNFRDERVTAVFVLNPVMTAIYGYRGLSKVNIPIFIGAGSYDPATPFIYEQARGFRYLKGNDIYLMLEEGEAHVDFSQIEGGINRLHQTLPSVKLPNPQLLNTYTDDVMLSFFEVYIANQPEYRVYLQSSYLAYLSKDQRFKAYLVTKNSYNELKEKVNQFLRENMGEQLIQFPDPEQRLEGI